MRELTETREIRVGHLCCGTRFEMDGQSDSAWRERIGNAVPPDAAAAIAGVIGRTLLLAWMGETYLLPNDPIWVQPLDVALAVETPAEVVG